MVQRPIPDETPPSTPAAPRQETRRILGVSSGAVDETHPSRNKMRFSQVHQTFPDTTHGSVIYADQARGGERGVNVGIYGSPMECLGFERDVSAKLPGPARHKIHGAGCTQKSP